MPSETISIVAHDGGWLVLNSNIRKVVIISAAFAPKANKPAVSKYGSAIDYKLFRDTSR